MNYRHLYHAGQFADVFKHVLLLALIQSLTIKEKPFCYLDTHAGIGNYDLTAIAAQKTQAYKDGIALLIEQNFANMPSIIQQYLAIVKTNNNAKLFPLQYYPGSPLIARSLLRNNDRMILSELHPEDYQQLKQNFIKDKQTAVHHLDGYQALKALLPPSERRGLVLIDPPFESVDEFEQIYQGLQTALSHWNTGIYAIWYPIKSDQKKLLSFITKLKNTITNNILKIELTIYPHDSPLGLNGCGMLIINPPWQFDKTAKELLPYLWQVLSPNKWGSYKIEWLKKLD